MLADAFGLSFIYRCIAGKNKQAVEGGDDGVEDA